MEPHSWRSFFSTSPADIWTVIHRAIGLAASDFPEEFRTRRCEIAEALFDRNICGPDADVTRSAVTICNRRAEIDEPSNDGQQSCVAKQVEAHLGCSYATTPIAAVYRVKEALMDSSQSDGEVLNALQKLDSMHISVNVIKETEIGKHVNGLRKHSNKEIQKMAKGLVRNWKVLVDDWVGRTQNNTVNSQGESITCHSNQLNKQMQSPGRMPDSLFVKDAHLQLPEERQSSNRSEVTELNRLSNGVVSNILVKEQGSIYGGLGPGRTLTNDYRGHDSKANLNDKLFQTIRNRNHEDKSSLKIPIASKSTRLSEGNNKRKLQNGYPHEENGKKERIAEL